MTEEQMTEKQAETMLRDIVGNKDGVHAFFTKVIQNEETLRVGNLDQEELGRPPLPVRSIQELKLFSEKIADEPEWAKYFGDLSEIQTRSSLSKDALLLKLSVTNKKELADMTPQKGKANKGWFRKKETPIQ